MNIITKGTINEYHYHWSKFGGIATAARLARAGHTVSIFEKGNRAGGRTSLLWPGIAMLSEEGRFSIASAANLYEGILDDIESHNYDVFTRRAPLSLMGKLRRLPAIYLRTKVLDKARPMQD